MFHDRRGAAPVASERMRIVQIRDRVFVVTGGGDGIGRQLVLQLLGRGARVAAVDIRAEALAATAQAAASTGRLATFVADITDREAVAVLPDAVENALGPADALLNVAGIVQPFVKISDLSYEQIDRVMSVNFGGTVNMTKEFLPVLLNRPEAYILNIVSMGGLVPVPGQGFYGASKGAVKLLTDALLAELMGTNVHVSAVFPGNVSTNIVVNSGIPDPRDTSGKNKVVVTSPQDAARMILEAVEHNRPRVLIGDDARKLDRFARLRPTRAITSLAERIAQRLLARQQ